MSHFLQKNFIQLILYISVAAFISYMAIFTIIRYQHIYASYYDLGIMNQTVYNTYKSITTLDPSRFLEMTDPDLPAQIKRMAIHNDVFLALLAPFYLIHTGPETLLFIQAFVVGLGALGIFGIVRHAFEKHEHKDIMALFFALSYLLYPALAKATIFEFHAVTLATTFLIFMFYFWLKRRFKWSFFFLCLALLTKEEVGLTTAFFGAYALLCHVSVVPNSAANIKKIIKNLRKDDANLKFTLAVIAASLIWFGLSVFVIIPLFRGHEHFALKYYDGGISTVKNVFNENTPGYLLALFGPVGFLSLFSPLKLLIALPEFAINLFSNDLNMRNIYYHYTAVITPFVLISAVYGVKNAMRLIKKKHTWFFLLVYLFAMTLIFAFWIGPLPYSTQADTYALSNKRDEQDDIDLWARTLADDKIKVSASSQIAPEFTSRRYFYNFGNNYTQADYVVIRLPEVYNYPEKDALIPIYNKLIGDPQFVRIYDKDNVVVYKKI